MAHHDDGKVYYTPDELGYQDRGKLKWMGMMLSDHTEALQQVKKTDKSLASQKIYDQQDLPEISQYLYEAFIDQKPVRIQANTIQRDRHYPSLPYLVKGYKDNFIYLVNQAGQKSKCQLDDIRHIEWMDPLDWYQKPGSQAP
ncbi:Uncharacterised protein [Alloiococcus otitis]|uniref:Uncharacterized protein n=1 Tax=Alloiococcus otitis ATCC 51267 TaxID=883081 RepID=K9ETJ6_9LACT|nr:YolD-like family protein [Alloiococcus otitis]EKU94297.1 hypothetical protein HMPREF9698_00329 [Alloiococcus otitis ATCC 51267]SUU81069.1 Uncharacterised protein [Alloiococcus otitis]